MPLAALRLPPPALSVRMRNMKRRRVVIGVALAAVGVAAGALWPRGPTEDELRNRRLAAADKTVQSGMTAAEVERLLGCPPNERIEGGAVERGRKGEKGVGSIN